MKFDHLTNISKPFIKWCKTVSYPETNFALFGYSMGDHDNIHITVNELKDRIKCRHANRLDANFELEVLSFLNCKDCVIKSCALRAYDCIYGNDSERRVGCTPKLKNCVIYNLNPIIFDDPKDFCEYEVSVQYYFDNNPSNKITDTITVDASSHEHAKEKACKKWPNAVVVKCNLLF